MFRTAIQTTPLTTDVANRCLSNISGDYFNGDCSFLATLRALVYPRLKDSELYLSFTSSDYSLSTFRDNTPKRMMNAVLQPSNYSSNTIIIHNVRNSDDEANKTCFDVIESTFCTNNKKFTRLEKVTDFFRKSFYTLCYVNPETNQVVVFVEKMNTKKMHYLQCAIFAFFPWYFNPEDGVSADEMELIQSLREETPDKYLECLSKIAQKYDFRGENIRHQLKGFETRFDRAECDNVRRTISSISRDIDQLNNSIADRQRQRYDLQIRLLGLETKIESGAESSDIMEYFLCNTKLVLCNTTDRKLVFAVKDYISYFDEDMAKSVIDNQTSYIYRPNGRDYSGTIAPDDMKRLMYAIFVNQTLRIRTCAAYEFELGSQVRGLQRYNFDNECENYIPNSHIDEYRCLGNYERAINNCIKNNDYIGAIEQCIASCKSLNFGDSTVMRVFMEHLYGRDGYNRNRCVEMPDGSVMTPKDAAQWLKEQEEKEKESTTETEVIAEVTEEVAGETVTEETYVYDEILEEL